MITRLLLSALAFLVLAATGIGSSQQARAADFVFETRMFGENQVPPVSTVGWGFFRFFFNEDRTAAEVTVDIKGLAGDAVTSADIHRGAPGQTGPVVKHLADGGFIVTSATVTFTKAELEDMAAGNWYISLKTVNHPEGELRGQIEPPAGFLPTAAAPPPPPAAVPNQAPEMAPPPVVQAAPVAPVVPAGVGVIIRPPDTGSAGLR